MTRVRGFGYVDDVEDDEFEDNDVDLEHGFASEHVEAQRAIKGYSCPRCNRILFEADVILHGVIFIRCRKCKREVAIETTPIMQSIGFINTLQTKENVE